MDEIKFEIPQIPEIKNGLEIKSKHLKTRAVYELAKTGTIALAPAYEGSSVLTGKADINRAIGILEQYNTEAPQIEINPQREQDILEKSRKAVSKTVKAFVRNDDLPPALAVTVGRLLKPSNVKITLDTNPRFIHSGRNFPTSPAERGTIEIALNYVAQHIETLKNKVLLPNNIDLSDDQILNLALREIVAHEYGHAVHRALAIGVWEDYEKGLSEKTEPRAIFKPITNSLIQGVFETIAPNEDLNALLKAETEHTNKAVTSDERISSGFQYLGLDYALRDLGLDSSTIDKLQETYRQESDATLEDFKLLIGEIWKHNLTVAQFVYGLGVLAIDLNNQGRSDLAKILQYSFGLETLGYYYPLSRQQIHEFVNTVWTPEQL